MQPNVETLSSLQLYYAHALQLSCLNAELRQNFEERMIEIASEITGLGGQTRQTLRNGGSGGCSGRVVSSGPMGVEPAVMETYLGCSHCAHGENGVLASFIQGGGMMLRCAKCNMPWREAEYRTACGHKVEDCTCADPFEVAEERYRKFCAGSSRAWRSLGAEEGTRTANLGISIDGVVASEEFTAYMGAAIHEKWTYLLADAERIARRALEAAREERGRARG